MHPLLREAGADADRLQRLGSRCALAEKTAIFAATDRVRDALRHD